MFTDSPAWKVEYGEKDFNPAFKALTMVERMDSTWTRASHVFGVAGSDGGQGWLDSLIQKLRSKRNSDFTFKIKDLSGQKTLSDHTHIIVKIEEIIARDERTPSSYRVDTVEKRIKMHTNSGFKMYKGEVHEMVSQLILESGLSPSVIEETKSPESFKTLHKPGWTNHEFVIYHLIQRAKSKNSGKAGYQIYSNKGDKVCFSNIDYKPQSITIEAQQLKKVIDCGNDWQIIMGYGGSNFAIGFDHEKLMPKSGSGSGEISQYIHMSPHSDDQELSAFASSWSDRNKVHGNYFYVALHGDDKIGDTDFPLKVDLSGSKFRENDSLKGYCVSRTHQITNGTYELGLLCVVQ